MTDDTAILVCRRAADELLTAVEEIAHHHTVDEELLGSIGCEHRDIATTDSALDAVLSLADMLRMTSNLIADCCGDEEIVGWQIRVWGVLPKPRIDQREQDYHAARIGTVKGLIDQMGPGDFLSRMSLEDHLAEMQGESSRG